MGEGKGLPKGGLFAKKESERTHGFNGAAAQVGSPSAAAGLEAAILAQRPCTHQDYHHPSLPFALNQKRVGRCCRRKLPWPAYAAVIRWVQSRAGDGSSSPLFPSPTTMPRLALVALTTFLLLATTSVAAGIPSTTSRIPEYTNRIVFIRHAEKGHASEPGGGLKRREHAKRENTSAWWFPWHRPGQPGDGGGGRRPGGGGGRGGPPNGLSEDGLRRAQYIRTVRLPTAYSRPYGRS